MFCNKIKKLFNLSNVLANKLFIIFALSITIFIFFLDNYFEHGGLIMRLNPLTRNKMDDLNLSNSVKTYLDNYFNQKTLNESEILDFAEKHTNLALKYTMQWKQNYSHLKDWMKKKEWSKFNLKTCNINPPQFQTIHMNNIYWQSIVDSEDLNLYSYNAYYDNRETTNQIKIIGISDHFNQLINTSLWCLFYFESRRKSVLTKVKEINELAYNFGNFYKRKGYYLPVLISCDIPKVISDSVPKAVAIKTNTKCSEQLNNLLRVIYEKPNDNKVEKFGVCVRSLYYHSYDYSLRLLEWLELIRLLGANKVFLYSFTLHPNMEKVIKYYMLKEFVDWRQSSHAGKQLNHELLDEVYIKRLGDFLLPQETMELNDCLHRNIHKYEYLVLIDIDELIVPVNAYNWHDMIHQIHNSSIIKHDKKQFGSYIFTQTRFYDDLVSEQFNPNEFLYTMRHLHRANFTSKAPKGFHLTKNIKVIWNHSALKCINKGNKDDCPLHWVRKDIGYLVHYRPGIDRPQNCSAEDIKSCATFDTILLKYNKDLETNVRIALNEIFQ